MSKNILGIFDSGDIESITTLIDKLEESSFDYLKLEGDGVKIVIGKKGMAEGMEESAPMAEARSESPGCSRGKTTACEQRGKSR